MPDPVTIVAMAQPTEEPFVLSGISVIPGGGPEYVVISSKIGRGRELILTGSVTPPDLVFQVTILDLPDQLEINESVRISAEVRNQFGELVDPNYTQENWLFAASAGASFGVGADSDLLTAGGSPASIVITATYNNQDDPEHPANGVLDTAILEVVSAVTIDLQITNPSSTVFEGQSYGLSAREIDGVTGAVIADPATGVNWTRIAGAGVVNGSTLIVNQSSAGQTVTVRATKPGRTLDEQVFSIAAQPVPGDFPENEPPGMILVSAFDGSTKTWTGWSVNAAWNNDVRLRVLADATSKFGSVLQKRWYIGDSHGWYAIAERTFGSFRELYVRIVFILSPNYQFHGSGVEKLLYMRRRNTGGAIAGGVFTLGSRAGGLRLALNSLNGNGNLGGISYVSADFNSNNVVIARNVWHTLELTFRLNTPGNSDGTVLVLHNGVPVQNWRWLGQPTQQAIDLRLGNRILGGTAWDSYQFNNIQAFEFWGGSGFNKQVDDYMSLSEFYVSGRN